MGSKQGESARKRKAIMRGVEKDSADMVEKAKLMYAEASAMLDHAFRDRAEAAMARDEAAFAAFIAERAISSLDDVRDRINSSISILKGEVEQARSATYSANGLSVDDVIARINSAEHEAAAAILKAEEEKKRFSMFKSSLAEDGHVPSFLRKILSRIEKSGGRVPADELASITVRVLKWATDGIEKEKLFGPTAAVEDENGDEPIIEPCPDDQSAKEPQES